MKKLKIYLDTSVISYLDQQDAPEKMAETLEFWEKAKAGEFDIIISSVTIDEINQCSEKKKKILQGYLKQVRHTIVPIEGKTICVAERFINFGILRQKSFDDCQHIAAAIVSGCDAIVSWNFKHIVNHRTIMGVKAVAALEGYSDLLIYTPPSMSGDENNDL
jgi:predicted nucleic acid-binding protein